MSYSLWILCCKSNDNPYSNEVNVYMSAATFPFLPLLNILV